MFYSLLSEEWETIHCPYEKSYYYFSLMRMAYTNDTLGRGAETPFFRPRKERWEAPGAWDPLPA